MCSSAAKGIKSLFLVFLSIFCSWSTGRYEGNQVQVLFSLVSFLYNDDLILPSSSIQVQPLMNNFIIFTSNAWSHVWGHLVLWTDTNSRVEERKVLYVCTRSKAHDFTRNWRKFHLQFPTWWLTRSAWHCTHIITRTLPICILKFKTLATWLQGQYVCLRSPGNKSVCKGLWSSIEACWAIHNLQVWLHGLCTIWRFLGSITIWTA